MGDKTALGDRMKLNYESVYGLRLPMRIPVIVRLDGKSFHSLTNQLDKPFDRNFIEWMIKTAMYVCEKVMGSQIAYIQSDEISILLHNYKKLSSQAYVGNEIQKIVSHTAGMASAKFTQLSSKFAVFDSRVFVLPEQEVANYFIWRQKDCERNSIQGLGQSVFSHKQLHKKNCGDIIEMLHEKGKDWNKLEPILKRGSCVVKNAVRGEGLENWLVDRNIPIFTQNREYIEKLLSVEKEL